LRKKDLLLLTELDYGMARSGNRFVARELAQKLELNYAFAPVYIALQKGSGVEEFAAGENTKSLHGLAMFSKFPIENAHAVALAERQGQNARQGKTARTFARARRRHPASGGRFSRRHRSSRRAFFEKTSAFADANNFRSLGKTARFADDYRRRLEHDDV
jgi:hypothetical protein